MPAAPCRVAPSPVLSDRSGVPRHRGPRTDRVRCSHTAVSLVVMLTRAVGGSACAVGTFDFEF